jgi:uncharacterized protein
MIGSALAVFAVTCIAGMVQSITGFGFGMMAVPLLSFFLQVSTASIVLALSSFSLNVYLIIRLRRHLKFSGNIPIMLSVALGVPIGLFFLVSMSEVILARTLGALLAFYVLWTLVRRSASRPLHDFYWGIPLGIASGALSGAFGMGGPPLVVFVGSREYKHLQHVVTIQLLLGISAVVRIAGIGIVGLIGVKVAILALVGLCGVVAGATLIIALRPRLSKKTMHIMIMVLISVIAIRYLFLPV